MRGVVPLLCRTVKQLLSLQLDRLDLKGNKNKHARPLYLVTQLNTIHMYTDNAKAKVLYSIEGSSYNVSEPTTHEVHKCMYVPAVPEDSLCDVLGPCLPQHRPLNPLTVKVVSCLGRPLPLAHLPFGHRLAGVWIERLVGRWEIRISKRFSTLVGQRERVLGDIVYLNANVSTFFLFSNMVCTNVYFSSGTDRVDVLEL